MPSEGPRAKGEGRRAKAALRTMSITSDADWDALREIGRIIRLTLDAVEGEVRPGVTTAELDRVAAGVLSAHRARSAPAVVYDFPATILISVNDEVVHGIPGARRLQRGDVVKLDVTAEKDGYMADAARTVVLDGGDERARRLRDCAEAAFNEALTVASAGNQVSEIGRRIEAEVRRRGFSVIRDLAGHGIGRTIHEEPSVPNYYNSQQRDVLTDGMVIAIEPIISSGSWRVVEDADGWTIRTRDGSLAAHYEHTVVITNDAPVLLTAAA
jgi:methionyl aminopeptidase